MREKVLAQLLSLAVQLKSLQIEQFEWLLHVVQYVSLSFIYDFLEVHASLIRYIQNEFTGFLLPRIIRCALETFP